MLGYCRRRKPQHLDDLADAQFAVPQHNQDSHSLDVGECFRHAQGQPHGFIVHLNLFSFRYVANYSNAEFECQPQYQ